MHIFQMCSPITTSNIFMYNNFPKSKKLFLLCKLYLMLRLEIHGVYKIDHMKFPDYSLTFP